MSEKICGVCSIFRLQAVLSQRSCQTGVLLHTVMQILAVIAAGSKVNFQMCCKFKRQTVRLRQSWLTDLLCHGADEVLVETAVQFKTSSSLSGRYRQPGGPLLPPPAPRRARRPPGPVLTKVQGAKGRKTYRAFSGLLHQDVLGALGLCADNSTGCELEKHVRRLVGSLP